MPECDSVTTSRGWLPRLLLFVLASTVLPAGGALAATLQFNTDAGALLVDVDDPTVKVSLDGRELRRTGQHRSQRRRAGEYDLPRSLSSRGE